MELLAQKEKKIMEECKEKAYEAGLRFAPPIMERYSDETLEYIVTNRDMIKLSPKIMIPNLYDYWVHDLEVIQGNSIYDLSPNNAYETVINTRPPISFYNDNNVDWMNVMIFYHVLGHIDCFSNNRFFRQTWDDDFNGRALADKRLIANARNNHGRWADYVIEFARSIDNIVDYYGLLSELDFPDSMNFPGKIDFYFNDFLPSQDGMSEFKIEKDNLRYNELLRNNPDNLLKVEEQFFAEVCRKFPEFKAVYEHKKLDARRNKKPNNKLDLIEYLQEHSEFLNKKENRWMKPVIGVVRDTSLYFSPQIRTKIINEGWASYWHEALFRRDPEINSHETSFSVLNSKVVTMPKVGLNPYGLGKALLDHIEESANRGLYSYEYERIKDIEQKKKFDKKTGQGKEKIFDVRANCDDHLLISKYVDQEFVNKNNLFVVGKRLNLMTGMWQYYIRSKKAKDYKKMLLDQLYHPPNVKVLNPDQGISDILRLDHVFEGKPLLNSYINMTMMGIEFLAGKQVDLYTHEHNKAFKENLSVLAQQQAEQNGGYIDIDELLATVEVEWDEVCYTMKDRKLNRLVLQEKVKVS